MNRTGDFVGEMLWRHVGMRRQGLFGAAGLAVLFALVAAALGGPALAALSLAAPYPSALLGLQPQLLHSVLFASVFACFSAAFVAFTLIKLPGLSYARHPSLVRFVRRVGFVLLWSGCLAPVVLSLAIAANAG